MEMHLKFIIPVIIGIASAAIMYFVRITIFRVLGGLNKKSEHKVGRMIISSIKTPSFYWCIAIGVYIGVSVSELPSKYIHHLDQAIIVIMVFSITLATANISTKIFQNYVEVSSIPIPTTGIAFSILRWTIIAIGILIILNLLGISITPLLTALGVGGLAVALALQDTLANLFAGIHVLMEKSIKIGDFIKLETGEEGFVEDITWRTTRLKLLSNNMVIIPNSKLAKSVVVNYSLPDKRMSLPITVSVSYFSDPERVEKILFDEAMRAIDEVPGLSPGYEPIVRFIPGFGANSIDFTLICQVKEFVDQYVVQHELRKRIFKRLKEEGIEIPFPQRTVYIREERERKT
ncbi:MAG: mechanosensitive ion channel family protein [Syntrophorhabdaceae bacterium]|nr:mechanosensitive ion channel family protein [Syntrophorhabdaceae bacterium]